MSDPREITGLDFSVPLPLNGNLSGVVEEFAPDIIHSHHPFLLGDAALRAASALNVPVVFTHHTRYELYGHNVAQDSALLKRLALSLSFGYCDMCDGVIAPSQSIASFLIDHHVKTHISVIPAGVIPEQFRYGSGAGLRKQLGIPDTAMVIGHVGRLAPEKNLGFLSRTLALFLVRHGDAHVLIVGDGPSRDQMIENFAAAHVDDRVHFAGVLRNARLADAYAAMNVFAFSSFSEAQGLVLVEAMMAGVPVVALDAPGVREVVADRKNGRRLAGDADVQAFASALGDMARAAPKTRWAMRKAARATADHYAIDKTVARTREFYSQTLSRKAPGTPRANGLWQRARRGLCGKWTLSAIWSTLPPIQSFLMPRNPGMMNSGWRRFLFELNAGICALICGWLLLAWCSLLRKNTTQLEKLRHYVADGNQVLAVFWHGDYFPLLALARGTDAVVVTNNSFRGHVIAGICRRFGYKPLLLPAASAGNSLSILIGLFDGRPGLAALALDGPSGPNRHIRSGALQMSAHKGVKLVPIGIACRRKWVMTSRWDRQQIPLPFNSVALAVGDMIDLSLQPDSASWQASVRQGMDRVGQQAERALDAIDDRAAGRR